MDSILSQCGQKYIDLSIFSRPPFIFSVSISSPLISFLQYGHFGILLSPIFFEFIFLIYNMNKTIYRISFSQLSRYYED